jgi:uncharacterized membrane protein
MTGLLARFLLSPAGYWQRCRSLGLEGAFEHEVADKQVTGRDEGLSPEVDRTRLGARDWAARHELLLYFVLAYLISWALWPLVILNPTSSPLVPFGPLIAAVVVALWAGGRRECCGPETVDHHHRRTWHPT